jgi:hypothetical protein
MTKQRGASQRIEQALLTILTFSYAPEIER